MERLYKIREELDAANQGDLPMPTNNVPETKNMTRGGPYVVNSTETEM